MAWPKHSFWAKNLSAVSHAPWYWAIISSMAMDWAKPYVEPQPLNMVLPYLVIMWMIPNDTVWSSLTTIKGPFLLSRSRSIPPVIML